MVNLIAPTGQLRAGSNDIFIEFRNSQSQLVDVGNVRFDMDMNMPGMQMHSGATIERTSTAGRYHAKVKVDMSGDWSAKLSYDGPPGKGQTNFSLTAR